MSSKPIISGLNQPEGIAEQDSYFEEEDQDFSNSEDAYRANPIPISENHNARLLDKILSEESQDQELPVDPFT